MGRRRAADVMLPDGTPMPEGVEISRAKGKTYHYWNPGRGTAREGERIPLPDPHRHLIAFKREIARLRGPVAIVYPVGTVGDLVERYKASGDFTGLAESTRTS